MSRAPQKRAFTLPKLPFAQVAIASAVAIVVVAIGAFFIGRATQAPPPPPPCVVQTFETDVFTVCTARASEIRLYWDDGEGAALRTFRALNDYLGDDARRVRFAMNAGMYNDAGAPIGLYVANGRERKALATREGPGNFHMMPNGVFSIDADGYARVETTQAFQTRAGEPRWATQSGPMLVIDGALHPAFQDDGPSKLIRNGVGVCEDGAVKAVISETPVSFGRFARLFRDQLGCANALFLDGTVSSLWAPSLDRRDAGVPLGPMLAAVR